MVDIVHAGPARLYCLVAVILCGCTGHQKAGTRCDTDDDCVAPLTCTGIDADHLDETPPGFICTKPCAIDDDCRHDPWEPRGYCDTRGLCERAFSK